MNFYSFRISDVAEIDLIAVCNTTCTFLTSIANSSLNYQAKRLNLTCSQNLTDMTITLKVQRNYNGVYGEQYQNFWNSATRMINIVNPSETIRQWFSLPEIYIAHNNFRHFIEVQLYLTPNSTNVTSNDTWITVATTICGEHLNFSGTF